MKITRLVQLGVLLMAAVAGACSKSSPTAPTPAATSTPTRVIRLGGNLNFGDVVVGQVRNDGILTISNDGNSALTVTGVTAPCGATAYSSSFLSGTVAPGATQSATIRFAPTTVSNCTGVLTVNADQTAGVNVITIVGNGVAAAPAPPPAASRTMTGTWVMTSARFPGSTMLVLVLQQSAAGIVTGIARDSTGANIGVTDPGGTATFDAAGNLRNLRIKFSSASNAVDFTIEGQMQAAGNIAGTISNTTATFAGVPINGLAVTLSRS